MILKQQILDLAEELNLQDSIDQLNPQQWSGTLGDQIAWLAHEAQRFNDREEAKFKSPEMPNLDFLNDENK